MEAAIASLAELSPLAAIVLIGGTLAMVLTQVAKQAKWSKTVTERVAAGIAVLIGVLAYIVSGLTGVFPDSVVEAVSTAVVVVAGVMVAARAAYASLGYAIPDGTTPPASNTEVIQNLDRPDPNLTPEEWERVRRITDRGSG